MLKKIYFKTLILMMLMLNVKNNFLYSDFSNEISQPESNTNKEIVIDFDSEEEKEIEIVAQEPITLNDQDNKVGLTMNFPIIGDLTLYSNKDESGKEILKGVLKKSINISEIDLKIDNFTVIIKNGKNPTITADVKWFSTEATLELLEIEKESAPEHESNNLKIDLSGAKFRLNFKDKLNLEILPSRELGLKYLDLSVYKDKKPELSTTINIFGKQLQLNASYDKELILNFKIETINLADLIPDLKDIEPFNKINLKNLMLIAHLGSKKEEKKFKLDIEGAADFSTLNLANINLSNLTIKGSYTKDQGLYLKANIDKFNILDFAILDKGNLNFYSGKAIAPKIDELNKKIAEEKDELKKKAYQEELKKFQEAEKSAMILIDGNGSLKLPEIGTFNLSLNANYNSKSGLELIGSVNQPITIGDFNINNAQLNFNQKTKNLSLTGSAKILGLDTKATLEVSNDNNNQKKYSLTASSEKKSWKIFSNIPAIKDLELKDVAIKADISKKNQALEADIEATGVADIFGTDMKADAKAIKAQDKSGILLKVESQDPKRLPADLGSILPIEKAYFIATNLNYKDKTYGELKPGINVDLKVDTNKAELANITKFIESFTGVNLGTTVDFKGNLTEKIGGSSLYIEIGKPFSFSLSNKKLLESDPFKLELTLLPMAEGVGVSGLSFDVETGMKLLLRNIDNKLNNLDFKTKVGINTGGSATIEGSMQGKLDLKPIGLPIEFGDIFLKAGVGLTTGLTEVGLSGEFDFGPKNKETKIAAAFDINTSGASTNIFAYGDLSSGKNKKEALNLEDIFNLATSAINGFESKRSDFKANIPELGIKKAKFYFSPANLYFADKLWPAGFNLDIDLDLFGKTASLEVNIDSSGFDAAGFLSEIELGPVKITGAGKNKVCSKSDQCLTTCDKKEEATKEKSREIVTPGTIRKPESPKINLDENKASKDLKEAIKEKEDFSKEKGAIVNLAFRPASLDMGLFLSCEVAVDLGQLGKISTDTCMNINPKGVYFSFDHNLFNSFKTQFTLNSEDFTKPEQWYICARLEQNLIDKLTNKIDKFTEEAKQEANKALNTAKEGVNTAQNAVNSAMKTAQNALKSKDVQETDLEKEFESAKKACGI